MNTMADVIAAVIVALIFGAPTIGLTVLAYHGIVKMHRKLSGPAPRRTRRSE